MANFDINLIPQVDTSVTDESHLTDREEFVDEMSSPRAYRRNITAPRRNTRALSTSRPGINPSQVTVRNVVNSSMESLRQIFSFKNMLKATAVVGIFGTLMSSIPGELANSVDVCLEDMLHAEQEGDMMGLVGSFATCSANFCQTTLNVAHMGATSLTLSAAALVMIDQSI